MGMKFYLKHNKDTVIGSPHIVLDERTWTCCCRHLLQSPRRSWSLGEGDMQVQLDATWA